MQPHVSDERPHLSHPHEDVGPLWFSARRDGTLFCAVSDDVDLIERVHACFDAGDDPLSCVGDGGTVEAVIFEPGCAEIACAGEGRIIRVRDGQLEQIVMNRGKVDTSAGDVFLLCSKELRSIIGSETLDMLLGSNAEPDVLAKELVSAILALTPGATVVGHVVGPDCI